MHDNRKEAVPVIGVRVVQGGMSRAVVGIGVRGSGKWNEWWEWHGGMEAWRHRWFAGVVKTD